MKRSLRGIVVLLVMILITGFTGSITSFANSSSGQELSYSKYLELQERDIIGEDVTYEYLQEIHEQSKELEKSLEKSSNFFKVENKNSRMGFTILQPGDVIITNATSSFGIAGHAGIALSSSEILHIGGPGEKPIVLSPSIWRRNYPTGGLNWTTIYRCNSSSDGRLAARWADTTYRNTNAKYKITMDLWSTHETYCSKIVWQAYNYGLSTIANPFETYGLKMPYDLPDSVRNISFAGNL